MGNFQSALLYPPNWLYLVLPLGPATNWQIALHVFLGGLFMYLWASRRGLHPVACLAAAALLMFCSPMFLHIFAGHLCNFNALIWVPLLLLAIDEFFKPQRWGWCLAGMFALSMEILAGHPQCVYYTIVTAAIYVCWCLPSAQRRSLVLAGLAGMLLGGAALAAVQLLPGWDASRESVRQRRPSLRRGRQFLVPAGELDYAPGPRLLRRHGAHGLLGALVPLGDVRVHRRHRPGIGGLRRDLRPTAAAPFGVPMVLLLLLLALGNYTPLFSLLVLLRSRFRQVPQHFQVRLLCSRVPDDAGRRRPGPADPPASRRAPAGGHCCRPCRAAGSWRHFAVAGGQTAAWWQNVVQGMGASGQSYLSHGNLRGSRICSSLRRVCRRRPIDCRGNVVAAEPGCSRPCDRSGGRCT